MVARRALAAALWPHAGLGAQSAMKCEQRVGVVAVFVADDPSRTLAAHPAMILMIAELVGVEACQQSNIRLPTPSHSRRRLDQYRPAVDDGAQRGGAPPHEELRAHIVNADAQSGTHLPQLGADAPRASRRRPVSRCARSAQRKASPRRAGPPGRTFAPADRITLTESLRQEVLDHRQGAIAVAPRRYTEAIVAACRERDRTRTKNVTANDERRIVLPNAELAPETQKYWG